MPIFYCVEIHVTCGHSVVLLVIVHLLMTIVSFDDTLICIENDKKLLFKYTNNDFAISLYMM